MAQKFLFVEHVNGQSGLLIAVLTVTSKLGPQMSREK